MTALPAPWRLHRDAPDMKTWRAPLARPRGFRKYVYIFIMWDGDIQSENSTGYNRRHATIGEALAALASDITPHN